MNKLWRVPAATLAAVALLTASAAAVSAHPHVIGKNGQVIANGQNHFQPTPVGDGTFDVCDTNTPFANQGPAWFGLETAHHGPDSGAPGKGDGCYRADASLLSEADDVNPAID